ncbi:MAG: hypothetical protein QE263_05520 [Vampirovibrionales bacterium]|nr:hypothetical protein [Vampirovibrionales bacterium]
MNVFWMVTVSALLATSLLPSAMAYSQPSDAASTLINITANEQNFDADGTTHLKGNVAVNFLNYRIVSPQATISFVEGSASLAQFFPGAMAKVTQKDQLGGIGEDTLNADVIKVYLLENRMVGEGNSISHFATIAANPISVQSSSQEFNQKDKTMAAHGNVRVDNNGTILTSPEARVWMAGGKPEKVVFSNGARAVQSNGTVVTGSRITITPQTGNMTAEEGVNTSLKNGGDAPTVIQSAFQQYDKAADTMLASGNVRIKYGDYKTAGPKAVFRMKGGDVDTIVLTGRSKIVTSNRQVEADSIVITTKPQQHFDAQGNVKSQFINQAKPKVTPVAAKTLPVKTASSTVKGKSAKAGTLKMPVKSLPGQPTGGDLSDNYLN